ncbi:MAG: hypothetical protein WAS07_14220 [Micropruina sp.]|nr:hypothetical protein [Micropruina sp.]
MTPSPSVSPLDTSNWIVYTSKQYGFSLKHPPGWTVEPAAHNRGPQTENEDPGGLDLFLTPAGDLYVSAWSMPAKDTPETLAGVAAWVQGYCGLAGYSCDGLDRAVPLCNERRDCHPGLLVTFEPEQFVEAFFTGGEHKGQIVGVVVGVPEGHENAATYGGARRLLEGFLSTMDVCPARPDRTPSGCS